MSVICDKCGVSHANTVCPMCGGHGLPRTVNPYLPPTFDNGKPWPHATENAKLNYIIEMLEALVSRRDHGA